MKKQLYRWITLVLALCLLVTVLPAAAEDGTSAEGEAAGAPVEVTPEPTTAPSATPELTPGPTAPPEPTATPEPTPTPFRTEFTWKKRRTEIAFMTTDTEPFGLGDLGGEMLMIRLKCQNAEGFRVYGIDQRLFALTAPSGKTVQCACYVIPTIEETTTGMEPASEQPYVDLLFDLGGLDGADPAQAQLAVYEKLDEAPACLVPLDKVAWWMPEEEPAAETAPEILIGDRVTFGHYEQDTSVDGKEPIEWYVLDKQDGKLLLLSRYSLGFQPYNEGFNEVTWETSALREWLNGIFLGAAFSEDEQAAIALTHVDNSDNQGYFSSTHGGNDTEDKIFALSYKEFKDLANGDARLCDRTQFVRSQGAESTAWWLRSPGMVQIIGTLIKKGEVVEDMTLKVWNCVRPALWTAESAVVPLPKEEEKEETAPEADTEVELTPFNTGRVRMRFGFPYDPGDVDPDWSDIEWIVLEIRDGKALVISAYKVAEVRYSNVNRQNWSDSKLRSWLEYGFLPNCFTPAERTAITVSEIVTDIGSKDNRGQETTRDRAFALSAEEAERFFAGDVYRKSTVTEGEYWWLRDHDKDNGRSVARIDQYGRISSGLFSCDHNARPAMRIDLKADLFTYDLAAETPQQIRHRETDAQTAESPAVPSLYDRMADLHPGEIVTFGRHGEAEKRPDGRTDIEWIVLEVQGGKALLISRTGLTIYSFYDSGTSNSNLWATSKIREVLNNNYLQRCFTREERVLILTTEVDNSRSQGPDEGKTAAKGNTKDRLFLLSYAEALHYFPTDSARRATDEEYMYEGKKLTDKDTRYYTEDGKLSMTWWLRPVTIIRNSNNDTIDAIQVNASGGFVSNSIGISQMVRPAMWVRLDPEIAAYGLDRRITFGETSYTVYLGTPLKLTPEVTRLSDDGPEKTVLEWKSSDEKIATVSGGTVKAVAPGKAEITAAAKDDDQIFATVEVEVRIPVKSITPGEKGLALLAGAGEEKATGVLHAKVEPEDAFHTTLAWSSSNEAVATVDSQGKVTAAGPGKATITAVTDDPSSKAKATFTVTVAQAVTEIVPDQAQITLQAGKAATVKAKVLPDKAGSKKISWSSSDESVVTVTDSGKVKAISPGTAVLTAGALDGSGVTATVTVTVEE